MTRASRFLVVLLTAIAAVTFAPRAFAETGDLTQPAGTQGCVEQNPTHIGDPCAAATYGEGLGSATYVATYGTNVYVASADGIEVLQKDALDPGLTDLQCLDGDGSDYSANPDCTTSTMLVDASPTGSIKISPDGKWVFVDADDNGQHELIVFSRSSTNGELTQGTCYTENGADGNNDADQCTDLGTGDSPDDAGIHLAVSPNGKWLFAGDGALITVFSINDTSGVLAATSCASEPDVSGCATHLPTGTNSNAGEIVISPDNKFLYYSNPNEGEVDWMSINQSTGALTNSGTSESEACISDYSSQVSDPCEATMRGMVAQTESLAISPDSSGKYVYALSGGEYTDGGIAVLARNPTTGALTQVSGAAGCATSSGTDDENAGHETGGPLPCEQDPGMEEAESLVPSPDGQNVYVITGYEGNESLIETHVNQSTGALTEDSDVFDDCYTSNIREDAEPFCTGYNAMDGIAEGLDGEPTFGISPDGTGVYVTSAGDAGLAIFQRQTVPTYAVNGVASPAAGGTVAAASDSTGANCSGSSCSVTSGGAVTLTATASAGYAFTGWSGGSCSGATNPCTVANVTAAETDTATFIQRFTVSATVAGSGTITATDASTTAACVGATCTVDAGDTVTLTPMPAAGYAFTGWSGGSCAGTSNPCTITSIQASESDTATFVAIPRYTVTGAVGGSNNGGSTVSAAGTASDASCTGASCTVNQGDTVKLTANPAAGYRLTGWSGGSCSGTTNPCTVSNVQANQTDTATFSPGYVVKATLNAGAGSGGNKVTLSDTAAGASCTGLQCSANPGDTVTLTATAGTGYTFAGWSGGSCSGTTDPCTITNVQANETDQATFTSTQIPVTGKVVQFASYGPGQNQPALGSTYSHVQVQIVNTQTNKVEEGPVTPDGHSNAYSLYVPQSMCTLADGPTACSLEVLADHNGGPAKVGDEVSLTVNSKTTAVEEKLQFGRLGAVAFSGTVAVPGDGGAVTTRLTLDKPGTQGAPSNDDILYDTDPSVCTAANPCNTGAFELVPTAAEDQKLHGGGLVTLWEKHDRSWVAVDTQTVEPFGQPSSTTSRVVGVDYLQAVDPVPSSAQGLAITGQVLMLDPYGPTNRPPTPKPINGYTNVSVGLYNTTGGPSTTPDNKGNYTLAHLISTTGPLEKPFTVVVHAHSNGKKYDSFARTVTVRRDLNPSTTLLNMYFDQAGDVPLDGKIVAPSDGHSVKTEIVVTAKNGTVLYDTLTSGLCSGASSRAVKAAAIRTRAIKERPKPSSTSDAGYCSDGQYLLNVPAPASAADDKFTVELKEFNATTSKWVKVDNVSVGEGEPPLLAFDGNDVPDLYAKDPVPNS